VTVGKSLASTTRFDVTPRRLNKPKADCSMPTNEVVPIIQHAIQLAVAPVFLLSGVAGLLGSWLVVWPA
jgi:hypothetical protein